MKFILFILFIFLLSCQNSGKLNKNKNLNKKIKSQPTISMGTKITVK